MPGIYLCNVVGTGTRRDPYGPLLTYTGEIAALAIDQVEIKGKTKARGIYWCSDNAATGAIITAGTSDTSTNLLAALQSTNVPAAIRSNINTWLAAGDLTALPAGTLTRSAALQAICVQIEPAFNLATFLISRDQ